MLCIKKPSLEKAGLCHLFLAVFTLLFIKPYQELYAAFCEAARQHPIAVDRPR